MNTRDMETTMTPAVLHLLQLAAIISTGLVAGLFYGYDCSIINSFRSLGDEVYLRSFQSINRGIQNGYFFASFMGTLLLLPIAAWYSRQPQNGATFYLFIAATLLYFIGVFGITIFGNVPLNDALDKFDITTASQKDMADMRGIFEKSWNSYHTLRTIASILSFGLAVLAVIKQKI